MSRIVTNTSANTVYKNYSRNNMALSSSIEKLSTGLRINRASDDAAGLAISETLRSQVKGTDTAIDNIANASNFINTADGYLQTANDILGRMSELAVQYGDGTKSAADKTNIGTEFDALSTELDNINTDAKFNGTAIFGAALDFSVDANGTQFTIAATALAAPNATTIAALSGDGTASLGNVQTAIAAVSTQRAELGAAQSQLNFKSTALQNYSENVGAAESRIRNVDMAQESTKLSRNQILVQSSTAMLSQANSSAQSVLSLLR